MRTVHLAETPFGAHLVAGLLREAGIAVVVEGGILQGAKGEIPLDLSTRPSVRVLDDADADRAVALIAARRREFAEEEQGPPLRI